MWIFIYFTIFKDLRDWLEVLARLATILFVPRSRHSMFTFYIHYIEVELVQSAFTSSL